MKRLLSSIIFIFMFASHAQTSNEEKLSFPGGGGCNGSCHIGGDYGSGRGRR